MLGLSYAHLPHRNVFFFNPKISVRAVFFLICGNFRSFGGCFLKILHILLVLELKRTYFYRLWKKFIIIMLLLSQKTYASSQLIFGVSRKSEQLELREKHV